MRVVLTVVDVLVLRTTSKKSISCIVCILLLLLLLLLIKVVLLRKLLRLNRSRLLCRLWRGATTRTNI